MVPGGGAVEMELSRQVESFSETCEGLEQYAVKRFANALQVVPRILAENTGKYFVAQYSWTVKFYSPSNLKIRPLIKYLYLTTFQE